MSATRSQDPDEVLFYDVDWTAWLEARGYSVADIVSFAWEVPGTITNLYESVTDAVARIYLGEATLNVNSKIVSTLEVLNKDGGTDNVVAKYSFTVLGRKA